MTWHLKDKQLEEKLIGLCSDFLKRLDDGVYLKRKDENYILVSFDRQKSGNYLDGNELLFWMDELEEIAEYNPHDWNEFPKVTPPEGVLMRVETACDSETYRECAIFEDGIWKNERNGKADDDLYGKVRRFRPWED